MTGKILKNSILHYKCRQEFYSTTKVKRFHVPDDFVPWERDFSDYNPTFFTATDGKPWADKNIDDTSFRPQWNKQDGDVNRTSFTKPYQITAVGYPLNPIGRTGIKGRGLLGRWGPNHAADPVITRWKRDNEHLENNKPRKILNAASNKPILQFIGIQRRDTKEWAIPGGMVDADEVITSTLKREFMEEALNLIERSQNNPMEVDKFTREIDKLFECGDKIFEGYVDDPRNTDNSWMETRVFNFHDDDNSVVGALPLQSGDDAIDVKWMDVDKNLPLYASHSECIELVAHRHDAHW